VGGFIALACRVKIGGRPKQYPLRPWDTKGLFGRIRPVARRTRTDDAAEIEQANDLETLVRDKRAAWRANAAKGRRRNRRYQRRLTHAIRRWDGTAGTAHE